MTSKDAVAVVGLSCWYPGARSARELWENILARRREFRQIPEERLSLDDYYDPSAKDLDKAYCRRAGVIDGFTFDWAGYRIPKTMFLASDATQWLSLEVSSQALKDAGYSRKNVPRDTTSVVVGNSLTGDQVRANYMRGRWPFVSKAIKSAASEIGLDTALRDELLTSSELKYKSVFQEPSEDSLAGTLSNVIAGRICNYYDLHGGGFCVDGACASSLLAVCSASDMLMAGNTDIVLAGGVDISLDSLELIGFSRVGALTADEMRVYDRRADGFIPGEGCGFVVLKRLKDARVNGDRVYAVITGWGISSDGAGGIMTPTRNGQALALKRAYRRSGYSIADLNFIEGHGTGTPVGDRIEIEGIVTALGDAPVAARRIGITSLKTMIGHTKAAAGIGALIKAVIACNRRVVPPLPECESPNTVFDREARAFYPVLLGEVHSPESKMRAGVSAMGFGGINTHVTLESSTDSPASNFAPEIEERALLASSQDSEIFVFGADSNDKLRTIVKDLYGDIGGCSMAELTDLAAKLSHDVRATPRVRAAVVAETPEKLLSKLDGLQAVLKVKSKLRRVWGNPERDIFIGSGSDHPRIGFLFPGQGSQNLQMGRTLIERHRWARVLVAKADRLAIEILGRPISHVIFRPIDRALDAHEIDSWKSELNKTEMSQPAIVLASLLQARFLSELGILPEVVGGHSLGELTAFHTAGAFDEDALFKLVLVRGMSMMADPAKPGAMASLACSKEQAEDFLKNANGYVIVANQNGPAQVVVSGEIRAVEEVTELASREGIHSRLLPVSNAFHSRLVKSAEEALLEHPTLLKQNKPLKAQLLTSMEGGRIDTDSPLITHFARQIVSPVDFVTLAQRMARSTDLIFEVGPGRVLSGLVRQIIGPEGVPCLPMASRPGSMRDLNVALGFAFAHGATIKWPALYKERLVHKFVKPADRLFISSPCESPMANDQTCRIFASESRLVPAPMLAASHPKAQRSNAVPDSIMGNPEILLVPIAARTGYEIDSIVSSSRLLYDLNLDWIKAGETIPPGKRLAGAEEALDPLIFANESIDDSMAPQDGSATRTNSQPSQGADRDSAAIEQSVEEQIIELVADRTGYPAATISAENKLLDDLNLDSIKAGEIVAILIRQFAPNAHIDPVDYANASLKELATLFDTDDTAALNVGQVQDIPAPLSLRRNSSVGVPESSKIVASEPAWVRSYKISTVPEALPAPVASLRAETDLAHAKMVILSDTDEMEFAASIRENLVRFGAQCNIAPYEQRGIMTVDSSITHHIAMLPRSPSAGEISGRVARMIRRLLSIARAPKTLDIYSQKTVAYVQFGEGFFGVGEVPSDPEVSCALAFARGLHLERPDLKVRVVDFSSAVSPLILAENLRNELSTSPAFSAAGYNNKNERRVQRLELQMPHAYQNRGIAFGADDVILASGGGKGITAASALAIAKASGSSVALIGSSLSPDAETQDLELRQTLARFREARIRHKYYQCDVSDAAAVRKIVLSVKEDFGHVSIVLHGAAKMLSRQAMHLNEEFAIAEVSPKLLGANHIFEALSASAPKLFLAFTSLSGVMGMHGNTSYGFSNEALDLLLRMFQQEAPSMQIQSIAWGPWAEIGGAAKADTVMNLSKRNLYLGAMNPAETLPRLLHLVSANPGAKQVLITGSVRGFDTWDDLIGPLADRPKGPFLENILRLDKGVAMVARTRITLKVHRYLHDHIFNGMYIVPSVFAMEAAAEAAVYLVEDAKSVCALEKLSLPRPLVVAADDGLEIEIHAERLEKLNHDDPERVRVTIRSEQTGFAFDYFSGTVVLGHPIQSKEYENIVYPNKPLPVDVQETYYQRQFFVRGPYQRIREVRALAPEHSVCVSEWREASHRGEDAFSPAPPIPLVLGDAFFRDSLLHSSIVALPQVVGLPVSFGKIEFFEPSNDVSRICVSSTKPIGADELSADLICTTESGRMLERISQFHIRIMERYPEWPSLDQLLLGRNDDRANNAARDSNSEKLTEMIRTRSSTMGFRPPIIGYQRFPKASNELERPERRRLAIPLIKRTARQWLRNAKADIQISWSQLGRPLVVSAGAECGISLTHDAEHLVCSAGADPQGCDLQSVTALHPDNWAALLRPQNDQFVKSLKEANESYKRIGARHWSIREAVIKAYGTSPADISVLKIEGAAVLARAMIGETTRTVFTEPVSLDGLEYILSLVVDTSESAYLAASAVPISRSRNNRPQMDALTVESDPDRGCSVLVHRFHVGARECATPSRSVHFSHYFGWYSHMREMILGEEVGRHYSREIRTGAIGGVTQWAEGTFLNTATAYDRIEARLWVSDLAKRSVEMSCEFRNLVKNAAPVTLALLKAKMSYSHSLRHGVAKIADRPEIYSQRYQKFALKNDAAALTPTFRSEPEASNMGAVLYAASPGPASGRVLTTQRFATALEEANFFGNIYFLHYFIWQGRIRDNFFWSAAPEMVQPPNSARGRIAEIRTLHSRVDYLREALPFDTIMVTMYLEEVRETSARMRFEFFRMLKTGREKLAVGRQIAGWSVVDKNQEVHSLPWPERLLTVLLQSKHSASSNMTNHQEHQ